MILTIDLGTSVTKVVVWGEDGQVAVGRSPLVCNYTVDNRAEQDPASWWPSVVTACEGARSSLGADAARVFGAVEVLGFSAARQTFVPVAADGTPLGPALLWSDRRAGAEADVLMASFDDGADGADGARGAAIVRRRTGVVLDAGSVAAKVLWLQHHEPERIKTARWLLAPRDLMAWRLTGEVATDHTLASASGLFEISALSSAGDGGDHGEDNGHGHGALVPGLVDEVADLLPVSRPSSTVIGGLLGGPAGELGLRAGIPVVIGAGDRACEVLGTGSSRAWPMVSWGTTANVSLPVPRLGHATPEAMIVTRGALGGWLLEGGLSAAGSLVDWLARLAGVEVEVLVQRAASSPPGSRGVIVLPWLGGARAPWWRHSARGAVVGLSFDHHVGDMARAVFESVAWDVQRCLESARDADDSLGAHNTHDADDTHDAHDAHDADDADDADDAGDAGAREAAPVGLVLGGGGANSALWTEILTAVTGLPARRRRSGEAASAGAAMIVARAMGAQPGLDLDRLDPVEAQMSPDPSLVATYAALRPSVDAAAAAVIELGR